MKQKERHHLKENELAHGISAASATLAGKKTPILAAAVIVGVVVVGAVGYAVVRQQSSAKQAEMLSAAMTIVATRIATAPRAFWRGAASQAGAAPPPGS